MKNFLVRWSESHLTMARVAFPKVVRVSGFHEHHFGARRQMASAVIEFQPANTFAISFGAYSIDQENHCLAEATIMGILDILFTSEQLPLVNVLLKIIELHIDPTDATENAFRMAGRDAARSALAQTKQ